MPLRPGPRATCVKALVSATRPAAFQLTLIRTPMKMHPKMPVGSYLMAGTQQLPYPSRCRERSPRRPPLQLPAWLPCRCARLGPWLNQAQQPACLGTCRGRVLYHLSLYKSQSRLCTCGSPADTLMQWRHPRPANHRLLMLYPRS